VFKVSISLKPQNPKCFDPCFKIKRESGHIGIQQKISLIRSKTHTEDLKDCVVMILFTNYLWDDTKKGHNWGLVVDF
jgi:hypothetical protein